MFKSRIPHKPMSDNKQPTCDECGGTKAAHNTETGEPVCNNRSCSESPMNEELTYM